MRGLLGREGLPPDHAMLFLGARSVHTFGMRFPLTVAFLDDDFIVVEVRVIPPGRIANNRSARHVLESADTMVFQIGERLQPFVVPSPA